MSGEQSTDGWPGQGFVSPSGLAVRRLSSRRYIPWDFQKHAKHVGSNVISEMLAITCMSLDATGDRLAGC